jgi:hypothetical protein
MWFIKKTIWGWNWVYGGEHGSIEFNSLNNGFSSQYFPNTEGTPFPLYFGVITNPDIKHISILEKDRLFEPEAKIIKNDYINVWYIYMNKFKGSKFEIYGFANNYKILSWRKVDISPYYAEQKPFKR